MTDKTNKAMEEVNGWIEWSMRLGHTRLPADQIVADVVKAYAETLVPNGTWFPIESLPDGRHVLLYWQEGERGNGGMECATVYRYDDGWMYWTHGGPNSGLDWEPRNGAKPTHWMPLPEPPL